MTQALVREARGGEQFQAFDLTEMCPLAEGEEVEKFCDIVPPAPRRHGAMLASGPVQRDRDAERQVAHLTLGSWLSSRKLARMEALSFWMTARSSAMVLAALTLRMNCFTEVWPLMVSFQCSSAMSADVCGWSLGPASVSASLARG